jgi:hypothetical protein
MTWYRLYFLSCKGDIRNVDEFGSNDDASALTLADRIHEAVSDLYEGYEIWQDSKCIRRCSHPAARPFIREHVITERIQAEILQRLKVLQASETAFSRSRHLVERINELVEVVGSPRQRKNRKVG